MGAEMPDDDYMKRALQLARRGLGKTSPNPMVGAVIVKSDRIIGEGYYRHFRGKHAEVDAIETTKVDIDGATMYVTLEPCPMCAGALVNARVARLVYGCTDPKAGAVDSLYELCTDPRLNHRLDVIPGVRADECAAQLKQFFARLRAGDRPPKPRPG